MTNEEIAERKLIVGQVDDEPEVRWGDSGLKPLAIALAAVPIGLLLWAVVESFL
jgi:hypothetical protein